LNYVVHTFTQAETNKAAACQNYEMDKEEHAGETHDGWRRESQIPVGRVNTDLRLGRAQSARRDKTEQKVGKREYGVEPQSENVEQCGNRAKAGHGQRDEAKGATWGLKPVSPVLDDQIHQPETKIAEYDAISDCCDRCPPPMSG
jgi:hypothetical protein